MASGEGAAVEGSEAVDILVIDDDACIRDMLVAVLHRLGYSSRTAGDGRAAQEQLTRHRFRLIVTDIFMPNMDGYEVMMCVRAICPKVPILAMTGGGISGGPENTLVPAKQLGCQRTLAKPFNVADFVAALQELLAPGPGVS